MKTFYDYETIIGKIFIEADGDFLTQISFRKLSGKRLETPIIKETITQLEEYFIKKRKTFDLPLKLEGTDFQKQVWKALLTIPYGKTATYKDIAKIIGNEKASRAVGMANNKNKLPIILPCHRVIGANGDLTGYAGGLEIKQKLLNLEKSASV